MDLQVIWSPEAIEDLESISEYIARDSEHYARAVTLEILAVSRSLADFPRAGRAVPEIGDQRVREQFVYSYRLTYRCEDNRVLIVAVIHGKRILEDLTDRLD